MDPFWRKLVGKVSPRTRPSDSDTVETPFDQEEYVASPTRSVSCCLFVLQGPSLGQKHELESGTTTIGSAPSRDIVIAHESVAPEHAVITLDSHGALIEDNGSAAGTFVNDNEIQSAYLRDGDLVKVGPTIFKFLGNANIESAYVGYLSELSTVDELTRAFNRRYFEEALERELNRARRQQRSLSLAMLEIDQSAGDQLLRGLAELVIQRSSKIDVVARYRDDTFAVILVTRALADATSFAQGLREAVERHRFEPEVSITVSIGVAELEPHHTADTLVDLVDARLRQAKRQGRNRVIACD
jgi:two-component system cell cycle response regulator